MYATMHTVIIDCQCTVSRYRYLPPKASRRRNFWSTTLHGMWVIHDVCLSRSSAFGEQFTGCRSIHWFSIFIARLPHLPLSTLSSSISMTYRKQSSNARPWAAALWAELCSWMDGSMQHDGCHSSQCAFHFDCSFDDTYDITNLNFVSKFGLYFSIDFLT